MKKQCSQEHLTPPKEGVREPKPLKKVPPESEERNWVDCAKVSHFVILTEFCTMASQEYFGLNIKCKQIEAVKNAHVITLVVF